MVAPRFTSNFSEYGNWRHLVDAKYTNHNTLYLLGFLQYEENLENFFYQFGKSNKFTYSGENQTEQEIEQ
jgi:hypothetical protein